MGIVSELKLKSSFNSVPNRSIFETIYMAWSNTRTNTGNKRSWSLSCVWGIISLLDTSGIHGGISIAVWSSEVKTSGSRVTILYGCDGNIIPALINLRAVQPTFILFRSFTHPHTIENCISNNIFKNPVIRVNVDLEKFLTRVDLHSVFFNGSRLGIRVRYFWSSSWFFSSYS